MKTHIKIGSILGLIGRTIMLVWGLLSIQGYIVTFESLIPAIIIIGGTIVWAALGISGAVLGFRDKKSGNILILIAGVGSLDGNLIPILRTGYSWLPLNTSFMGIDAILILIGGILGIALWPRKE